MAILRSKMVSSNILYFTLLALSSQVSLASPVEYSSSLAPLHIPTVGQHNLLNDSYIIMLKDDIPPSVFSAHLNFVEVLTESNPLVAEDVENAFVLDHVYDSVVAKGYAGRLSQDALERIRSRPEVKFVEQDMRRYVTDVQNEPPWGLARINHHNKLTPRNMHYVYPSHSGSGVMVYVLDTGVYTEHRDFEGRARQGKTFLEEEKHNDYNGHGTHVAGIIASHLYGVAKQAQITSVKVLDKDGHGTTSKTIAGIQWAVLDAQRLARQHYGFKGAVINLSMGGSAILSEIDAVNNAVKAGVHVVVAAGNDNTDACKQSPAAAELAITVAASTINDTRAEYSNYGECVDIFAPGDNILSVGISGSDSSDIRSGTSMAAPHVSGLIAHFLSSQNTRYFDAFRNDAGSKPLAPFRSYTTAIYGAVYNHLPKLVSQMLPSQFTSVDKIFEKDKILSANGISPSVMKEALRSLSSKGQLASYTLPAGTPNLLAYNDYSHIC